MLSKFQDWLFPKIPLIPIVYDEEGYQVCFGGARRHKTLRMNDEEYTVRCQYSATHPFTSRGRQSLSNPPLHWHRHQTEWFNVQEGTVGYVLNGKECTASKGEEVILRPGDVHSFWCDPTNGDDLVLDITVRPAKGLDEQWFNSTYGYFESTFKLNKPPALLQVMASWYEADAVPGMVPKPIGLLLVYVFGIIGQLAGYKGTYPIYANSRPPK